MQDLSTKLYDCTIDNLININEVFFHINLHFNLAKMSQKPCCLNADVKCFGKLSKQKAFLISCFKLYSNLANIMEFSQLSSPASAARDRWPQIKEIGICWRRDGRRDADCGWFRQTDTLTHSHTHTWLMSFGGRGSKIELKMVLYDYSNYNYYKYNIITNAAVQ